MENNKLFVGNLHYSTTSDDLKELFSLYSPVSVQVTYDKQAGMSKGFAFICFDSRDLLYNAINQLDGVEFKGSKLELKEALPQPDRNDNVSFEMTNKRNVVQPFFAFFQLQILWNRFFMEEDSRSHTEDVITKLFNEHNKLINYEASHQKTEAESQFAQIKNEYKKTTELLKPFVQIKKSL